MAIKLIANYSKRLGLPGYSSHQFSVSVETELVKTDEVPAEAGRLYQLLQHNVDEQILVTGFVPPVDYGTEHNKVAGGPDADDASGNLQPEPVWKCSNRQRGLILKIIEERHLEKTHVESLAVERFGKGVRSLGKIEASRLIDDLLGGVDHGAGRSKVAVHAEERGDQ
jgi:hypothetical protein